MEVHHHPDIHHNPKKWKEYFLEFLMIFLAVTMGFFAENIRERQTEKRAGREYIYSLLNDLKADTAAFNENARSWTNRSKRIDSLRYYIQLGMNSNVHEIYYLVERMYSFSDFKYHDATITQLKNTGHFRLINKDRIIDSLIAYDTWIRGYYSNAESALRGQYIYLRHMQTGLFNSFYFKRFSSELIDSLPPDTRKSFMIKYDPNKIFEYLNELYTYRYQSVVQIINDDRFRDEAARLIALIQKEYDL